MRSACLRVYVCVLIRILFPERLRDKRTFLMFLLIIMIFWSPKVERVKFPLLLLMDFFHVNNVTEQVP